MKDLGMLIKDNEDILGYVAYMPANKTQKKRKTVKKVVIKDEDLLILFEDIKSTFGSEKFKNSDLKELCDKWNLTSRQTPSRLKKMADQGLLTRYETKPLTYQVK